MDGVGFAGRMEVLTEPAGRRVWPLETKLRIVAESYAAGASVGEVARRHGLLANQVTRWRRQYRQGELVPRGSPPLPPVVSARLRRAATRETEPMAPGASAADVPPFVPLMLEAEDVLDDPDMGTPADAGAADRPAPSLDAPPAGGGDPGRVEVEAGGVVVRLPGDVSPARLAAIVLALRGAAGGTSA